MLQVKIKDDTGNTLDKKGTPFIDVSFLRDILNSLHVPGGRIPKGGIDNYYLNIALTFAWTSL